MQWVYLTIKHLSILKNKSKNQSNIPIIVLLNRFNISKFLIKCLKKNLEK